MLFKGGALYPVNYLTNMTSVYSVKENRIHFLIQMGIHYWEAKPSGSYSAQLHRSMEFASKSFSAICVFACTTRFSRNSWKTCVISKKCFHRKKAQNCEMQENNFRVEWRICSQRFFNSDGNPNFIWTNLKEKVKWRFKINPEICQKSTRRKLRTVVDGNWTVNRL